MVHATEYFYTNCFANLKQKYGSRANANYKKVS